MEKKSSRHGETINKHRVQAKVSKSTQQSNRMRIKTEGIAWLRWVKEQLEKEIKKNVNNNKQTCLPFVFSIEFVVVVVVSLVL